MSVAKMTVVVIVLTDNLTEKADIKINNNTSDHQLLTHGKGLNLSKVNKRSD